MKSDIARLCLGTAQFHSSYGATNKLGQPSEKTIRAIIACAAEAGIRYADTASEYYRGFDQPWNVVCKLKARDLAMASWYYGSSFPWYAILSHEPTAEHLVRAVKAAGYKGRIGQSIYHDQYGWEWAEVVQFPLSIADRRMMRLVHVFKPGLVKFARTVFLQGKLLQMGYSVADCLGYVLRQPVDFAIVGVNSVKELEEIIKAANDLPEHVPEIPAPILTAEQLDPRTWK